jgi:hypothetical protein
MNKSMLLITLPSFLASIINGVLIIIYLVINDYRSAFFGFFGMLWMIWLGYSFLKNKDLPAVGAFSYRNGENQAGRIFFMTSVPSIYLVGLLLQFTRLV